VPLSEHPWVWENRDRVDPFAGQNGPVLFFGQRVDGPDVQERHLTVPHGKALATLLAWNWASPLTNPGLDRDGLLREVKTYPTPTQFLQAEIDGVPVPPEALYTYQTSPFFDYRLPDDSVLDFHHETNFPAGRFHGMVVHASVLMIKPLPRGEHVIHFYGRGDDGGFFDSTTRLTVV
jgi:hypothetical protein